MDKDGGQDTTQKSPGEIEKRASDRSDTSDRQPPPPPPPQQPENKEDNRNQPTDDKSINYDKVIEESSLKEPDKRLTSPGDPHDDTREETRPALKHSPQAIVFSNEDEFWKRIRNGDKN